MEMNERVRWREERREEGEEEDDRDKVDAERKWKEARTAGSAQEQDKEGKSMIDYSSRNISIY